MDYAERHAAAADHRAHPRHRRAPPKASSCRRGRRTAARSSTSTWTTTGGHIKRVRATGGAAADADALRRLLPRSRVHARWLAHRVHGRRGGGSALFDPAGHAARGRLDRDEHAPREIGGVSPPNTLEIRWMPAAGGAGDAVAVGAGRTRPALRAQRLVARLLHDQPRAAVDHHGRLRPPHASCASPASGPGNNPPSARRDPRCRPTARARSSACRASITSSPCRGPDARRSKCASRAAATTPSVPVKRDVARRRRLPRLDRRRQGGDLGVGRAVLPPGRSTPPSRRRPTSSSSCRASRPKGSVLLTGARIITMKGDEVIAQRRRAGHRQPHRRRRQARARSRRPPARAPSTSPARRSCRASSTRTRTCGRRAACTRPRCGSTSPTSPTA